MYLTDLPEDVLVIIIKKLDLISIYNLYETCAHFKYIVRVYNVIKVCVMALNTMATAQTFKLNFIKEISGQLQELSVCGVSDLNKASLLVAVKKMKCLKTLDVSYTNITVTDLIEVYKSCPTLKNITCNFVFGKDDGIKIPQKVLGESQNMFQNFQNIHLVGNARNLLCSNLALWVLQKAKLNLLQITIAENENTVYELNEQIENNKLMGNFKFISVYVLNDCRTYNPSVGFYLYMPSALSTLSSTHQFEFIAIVKTGYVAHSVYVSASFEFFFNDYFQINSKCVNDISAIEYIGNAVIMLWNKSKTVFDKTFFTDLKYKLIEFFPSCSEQDNSAIAEQYNWFFLSVESQTFDRGHTSEYGSNFKKKRCGPPKHLLDYDTFFKTKKQIKLTMSFNNCISCPVVLSTESEYLRKLTYLSLSGNVQYSGEFFNVLFRCCVLLETLNVETITLSPCASSIARNLPLSRSIKNLRLVDKRIDFKTLFSSLSHCHILENIHLVDVASEYNEVGDPSILFEKCKNLFCLFILASMSPTAKTKKLQMLKKLKERYNKPYLHLELCTKKSESRFYYDPYIHVFKLNPINPLEQHYPCFFNCIILQ